MEWLTWFDLKKYRIVSIHVVPHKPSLYGVPRRSITIHLLHMLNDYPPMEVVFEIDNRCGRTVVASITNDLVDENKVCIPISVAKDFDNDNLQVINHILKTLSQGE